MCQKLLVRRPSDRSAGSFQRGLEPTAVLIRAFQVQVSWPRQFRTLVEHGKMGGTRIEPDVQSIGKFAVLGSRLAQQLLRIQIEPRFDTMLFDALRYLF